MTGTFPGANGISVLNDRLFVGDSKNGTVTIFEIQKDNSLTQLQQVVTSLDLLLSYSSLY